MAAAAGGDSCASDLMREQLSGNLKKKKRWAFVSNFGLAQIKLPQNFRNRFFCGYMFPCLWGDIRVGPVCHSVDVHLTLEEVPNCLRKPGGGQGSRRPCESPSVSTDLSALSTVGLTNFNHFHGSGVSVVVYFVFL